MKFEQYMRMIEQTHDDHKKGSLNEIEYINAYNEILDSVIESKTIDEEERKTLITEIKIKIGQIPKVEQMRKEAKEQELQEKELAFKEAKSRFRKLSLFQRIKLNLKGQGPEQVHRTLGSIEEINGLYRR